MQARYSRCVRTQAACNSAARNCPSQLTSCRLEMETYERFCSARLMKWEHFQVVVPLVCERCRALLIQRGSVWFSRQSSELGKSVRSGEVAHEPFPPAVVQVRARGPSPDSLRLSAGSSQLRRLWSSLPALRPSTEGSAVGGDRRRRQLAHPEARPTARCPAEHSVQSR